MRRQAARSGFTIVEMLIIVVIVGILITIAYPYFARRSRGDHLPARLSWVAGPDSAVSPGAVKALAVRVEDDAGQPVAVVVVDFESGSGASIIRSTATSDSTGMAPVSWHFASDTGHVSLLARVREHPDVSATVSTSVRAAAPAATR